MSEWEIEWITDYVWSNNENEECNWECEIKEGNTSESKICSEDMMNRLKRWWMVGFRILYFQ